MIRGNFQYSSPGMQFLLSLLIILSTWLIFQLIAILSGALFFDVGFQQITDVLNNSADITAINYQKYVQSVISVGMFIVSSLLISFLISENMWDFLKANFFPGLLISLLVILVMVFTLPLSNFLTYLNNQLDMSSLFPSLQEYMENMESEAEKIFERFLDQRGVVSLLVNILVIAVIPGIGEELLFRGVLQRVFIKWTKNVFTAVIITSLVFALLHFQFLSVLPRFILGIILGYIYVWTGSLWMPVLAHFANNAMAVIYYHYMYNGSLGEGIENVGKPEYHPIYALLGTILIVVLMAVIWRLMQEKINRPQDG